MGYRTKNVAPAPDLIASLGKELPKPLESEMPNNVILNNPPRFWAVYGFQLELRTGLMTGL